MVEAESAKSHQELGNEFYKADLWLKAAACYTKGIKEEPEKVALYRYSLTSSRTLYVLLRALCMRLCLQQPVRSPPKASEGRQSIGRCRDLHTAQA